MGSGMNPVYIGYAAVAHASVALEWGCSTTSPEDVDEISLNGYETYQLVVTLMCMHVSESTSLRVKFFL
eukprot:TsM_000357000 transcript=TsM_000357000 gene=TsM_000357000